MIIDTRNARDPKFTIRIERALRYLARHPQRPLVAAAASGCVATADLNLWLDTFNAGRTVLTEARIEEVKREVGVIVIRELTPEEREEIAARRLRREADEAVAKAGKAAEEADRASRHAYKKREREKTFSVVRERKKAPAKPAAPVRLPKVDPAELALRAPHQSADTVNLPWRKIGTGWIIKSVRAWRSQLEAVALGTSAQTILLTMPREPKVAFCTFRLRYFGPPDKLTQEAALDLLAFVQKVEDARVVISAPRVRSLEAIAKTSADVEQKLEACRVAFADLERAIREGRRAA